MIESIHDGSFSAGDMSKLGIFLPAGFARLRMGGTGVWMFCPPFVARRRRRISTRGRIGV